MNIFIDQLHRSFVPRDGPHDIPQHPGALRSVMGLTVDGHHWRCNDQRIAASTMGLAAGDTAAAAPRRRSEQ